MSDVRHTNDPHVPLPGLLEATTDALFAEFRQELNATEYGDIRPTHGCCFRFLHGDGMRLTDLAGLAGMTKQSVGEIIDDLVERGYVERVPDPLDKRAKLIRLTHRGAEAQRTGRRLFAKVEARWAKRYGAKRMAELRELLEDIVASEAPLAVPELAPAELARV